MSFLSSVDLFHIPQYCIAETNVDLAYHLTFETIHKHHIDVTDYHQRRISGLWL
jgi:hypothetical protein